MNDFFNKKEVFIDFDKTFICYAAANCVSDIIIYAVTNDLSIYSINLTNNSYSVIISDILTAEMFTAEEKSIEEETKAKVKEITLSKTNQYCFIYQKFGEIGVLIDLFAKKVIKTLKRDGYHNDVSSYSNLFFEHNNKEYFIYQTEWNKLDIIDLSTFEIISTRNTAYGSEDYIDYFYSDIIVSDNGEYIVSTGWCWQPFAVMYSINTKKIFENFNEIELQLKEKGFGFGGYYWDRAKCFIDNETIAFVYNINEFDPEDDEDKTEKIVIYNLKEHKEVKRIDFNGFELNEYFEPKDYGSWFAFNKYLYTISECGGVSVIDLNDETVLFTDKELYFDLYCKSSNVFVNINKNNEFVIYKPKS